MRSYPLVSLKTLGDIVTGSTPLTSNQANYGGHFPFVTPAELEGTDPITSSKTYLTELGLQSVRRLPANSILVCCIGSLGKVGISGTTVATNQQINAIIPNPSVAHPRYLLHACRRLRPTLEAIAPSTTLKIVNKSRFAELQIPLPQLEEQRRIAAILDQAEALRAKRRQALAKLDTLTQSLFVEMFGDPSAVLARWQVVRFEAVLEMPLRNGLSPSNSGHVAGWVLTLSAVTGDGFDETSLKAAFFTKGPPVDQTVNKSDLLICRGNGNLQLVGKGYFPNSDMPSVLFPDTMIAARISEDAIDRFFLEYVWNSNTVRAQIQSVARTTNGTQKVNQGMLESILIPAPPIDIQREFGRKIRKLRSFCTQSNVAASALNSLSESLQHRAFRGEL